MRKLFQKALDAMPGQPALRRRAERHFSPAMVNFWCHALEGAIAMFGFTLAGGTLFQVLAVKLGATPIMLGALEAVLGISFLVPLFTAHRMEAAPQKRRILLLFGLVGERLPLLLTALCVAALARPAPTLCLLLIAAIQLVGGILASVQGPTWFSLLAETIPASLMGRLMGLRHSLSALLGLAAGPICGAVLAALAFPGNYVVIYLAGFAFAMVSWWIFAMVDDVPPSSVPKPQEASRYMRSMLGALLHDRSYRCYLLHGILSQVPVASNAFYAMTVVRHFGMSDAFAAGALMLSGSAARVGGSLLFPLAAERFGHRRVLAFGMVVRALAGLVAAHAPSGLWVVGTWFFVNIAISTRNVCLTPLLIAIAPSGKRVGYATFSRVIQAPAGMALALAAGAVMQTFGHTVLFSLAAVGALASILALRHVEVPPQPAQLTAQAPASAHP